MKVPVLIQHAERKVAASLVIRDMVEGERYEIAPTQHHTVHLPDGETRAFELIAAPWSGADPACVFPVAVLALREYGCAVHVSIKGAACRNVEVPAGEMRTFELSSAEDLTIELSVGAAAAAPMSSPTPKAKRPPRRPGRVQVKPRQNRGRKAGR